MKPDYTLFDRDTVAIFWGLHAAPIQRMLDYDYIVGRKPSISAIVAPTRSQRFHKCFYGTDEVLIPVYRSVEAAAAAHPEADVMVNFASFRTAYGETMAALEEETIRTVAVIAEGIPERLARGMRDRARELGKTIIGPATVGGIAASTDR